MRKIYKAYNEKICYKDVMIVREPEKAYELLWGEKPELCGHKSVH